MSLLQTTSCCQRPNFTPEGQLCRDRQTRATYHTLPLQSYFITKAIYLSGHRGAGIGLGPSAARTLLPIGSRTAVIRGKWPFGASWREIGLLSSYSGRSALSSVFLGCPPDFTASLPNDNPTSTSSRATLDDVEGLTVDNLRARHLPIPADAENAKHPHSNIASNRSNDMLNP